MYLFQSSMLRLLGSPMTPIFFFSRATNFPCFSLIEIILLVTKNYLNWINWTIMVFTWKSSPVLTFLYYQSVCYYYKLKAHRFGSLHVAETGIKYYPELKIPVNLKWLLTRTLKSRTRDICFAYCWWLSNERSLCKYMHTVLKDLYTVTTK